MGNNNSRGKQDLRNNQPYRPQSAPLYPTEPPPPYSATPQPSYAPPLSYGHGAAASMNHLAYQTPPGMVYVAQGSFDAGARFDHISRPSIPPPPPGVYPNAAQLAAASGQSVILDQKKAGILGNKGAGYTFW